MYGNNTMMNMNGMPSQFGYGFNSNQGNFNGMGFNGMNPMNGMPNMMGGGFMNPMGALLSYISCAKYQFLTTGIDFNNMNMPNGMYGGFGGNMGMPGMNDMSAMMNYGGGYGNGWQGGMNGSGYGNFNDFNPMGGYNQSGAQYPQMMNQYPKNNFQNQNRFPPNGAAFSQKNNRRGSYGNLGNQNGPGLQQNAHSRPGSRSGPSQNVRRFHKEQSATIPARHPHSLPIPPSLSHSQVPKTDVSAPLQRDGESPAGDADAPPETKVNGDQAEASAEPAREGKAGSEDASESTKTPTVKAEGQPDDATELTRTADDETNNVPQTAGLNHIQTVDSVEADQSNYDQSMMNNTMQLNQGYPQGMMNNDFSGQGPHMNGPYGGSMGFNQHQNYGHSGGFNAAYGAATVLTGEPRGVGVEGAPTGPRAMREGRPNTGFSSRVNNTRYNSHTQTPSVPSVQDAAPASPQRKGRG